MINKNVDLSLDRVGTAVRLSPYFENQFCFISPLDLRYNDPTPVELKALKEESGSTVQIQLVCKKPFLSFSFEAGKFINDTLTSNLSNIFSHRKPENCVVEFR